MQSWDSVKVKTEGHAREGQAGRVTSAGPYVVDNIEVVSVQFDADSVIEEVAVADLVQL